LDFYVWNSFGIPKATVAPNQALGQARNTAA
jgi:hypothetical protein